MNEFLTKIASILEVDNVTEADELKAFPQWDSLSVLSVIAMLDASYGVNLRAADFGPVQNVGDLWNLVQSRKGS
jgi:acyl carrier protein